MLPLPINPFTVNESDFPYNGTAREQWCFLLNYALLAPSEYNTQPWMFKIHGSVLEFYADYSRSLPVVDPDGRELLISCGAAYANLRVAIHHFGLRVLSDCFINNDTPALLAHMTISGRGETSPEVQRLFAAIPQRHTNRQVFEERTIPNDVITRLQWVTGKEGTWLKVIQDEQTRKVITDLIVAGDRTQWANKRFRDELAAWVHAQKADKPDGLPAYAHARGSFHDRTNAFVIRTFDLWREEAARDRQLTAGAPLLAVLGTFSDTPDDWFAAGVACQMALLEICASGLQASFVNQPIEIPTLRDWLRHALDTHDAPQLVLRIGYGIPAHPTPRRSVRDVLVEETE